MSGTGYSRRQAWALVRRVVVAVVGGTIIAAGVALLFIPGPGLLVLLLGLAILATEFSWARQVRQWVQHEARSITQRLKAKRRPPSRQPR
ncbi:MAG: PGPGW domain-containing protein [Egibacteraceae bacterium]